MFTMKNLEWKKVGWILNFLLKYYKTNNMIEIGEIWKGFSFTILQQAAWWLVKIHRKIKMLHNQSELQINPPHHTWQNIC